MTRWNEDIGVKNIAAAMPVVTDALQKVRDTYPLYEDVTNKRSRGV
jgi:hypothetical protein